MKAQTSYPLLALLLAATSPSQFGVAQGVGADDDLDDNDKPVTLNIIDGVLIFDAGQGKTKLSVEKGDGMEEVAEYFGVDSTDPGELQDFVDSFGECVFCDSGEIEPEKTFASTDCSDWLMFSLFSKEEECSILRAAAVSKCGCRTESLAITESTPICNLCLDGNYDQTKTQIHMDKFLPTMSNELTCRDIAKLPAVEGDKTCSAVAAFGHFCGCGYAEPQCHLCPDGSRLSFPDRVLEKGYYATDEELALEVEGKDLTCASVEEIISDNAKSTCVTAIHDFEQEVGIILPAYCGCHNALPPVDGGCSPCPDGYEISGKAVASGTMIDTLQMTCEDWATLEAPLFLRDHEVCHSRQQAARGDCCVSPEKASNEVAENTLAFASLARQSEASPSRSYTSMVLVLLLVAFSGVFAFLVHSSRQRSQGGTLAFISTPETARIVRV